MFEVWDSWEYQDCTFCIPLFARSPICLYGDIADCEVAKGCRRRSGGVGFALSIKAIERKSKLVRF